MGAVSNNIESDTTWIFVTTESLKQKEVNSESKEMELVLDQIPVLQLQQQQQLPQKRQEDAFEVKDSTSPTGSNETQAVEKVCVTDSGATPNKSCIFPFKFNGVLYNECTWTSAHFTDLKPWCSTFVDETGERPIF